MQYVDLSDVQGNILRGYGLPYVRHIVVKVADAREARRFIGRTVSGSDDRPQVMSAAPWERDEKPDVCLNVGVTAAGLRALGLPSASLSTFPAEFVEGAPGRAHKVGDVDESAPEHWCDGLGDPDNAHLMWTIHASSESGLDAATGRLVESWHQSGAFIVTSRLDGAALPDADEEAVVISGKDGSQTSHLGDKVHFGYRDSIAQPRFEVNGAVMGRSDDQPATPVGAVLLGYAETSFPDVTWDSPQPKEFSDNGCYNAFRVLRQDVDAFEEFLEATAEQYSWNKEYVAAKLMGRWRNGVPLVLAHDEEWSQPGAGMPASISDTDLNDFDYPDYSEGRDDIEGRPCPLGAHIRRANPRGSRIVQRSANYTRPIVRRGMPYGPPYDPENPRDGRQRGLLGNFMCSSLIAQFEAVMYDWINLGLQDPRITGTNDPIIGANKPETSRFEIRLDRERSVELTGFPRFTHVEAGIYLFCPSLSGLRYLASLPN